MALRRSLRPLREPGRLRVLLFGGDDPDFDRYGLVEVGAERRHELFNEHTRLEREGFTEVRRGYFVREGGPEISHVLHHHTGKHSTYVTWGLSLAFVPHEFGAHIRFHRTLKSARMDLFNQDSDSQGACYLHDEPRAAMGQWSHAGRTTQNSRVDAWERRKRSSAFSRCLP